ncbi:MAG: Holliday junction resolvase RuvX [Methylococcaceae bacterium]|jgi:putative Holliday junction resolvase|nr:Holliday junction resolvase RuvX [Methylococcaceae bacterium]
MADSSGPAAPPEPKGNATYLGFDFGRKNTGVAVGQRITGTASGLETIRSTHPEALWDAISRLVKTWQPTAFVVGVPHPLVESEAKNPLIALIRQFCLDLEVRYQRPVYEMDEALSTRESQSLFYSRRTRKSVPFAAIKDELAAMLILQTWLDHTAPKGSLDA